MELIFCTASKLGLTNRTLKYHVRFSKLHLFSPILLHQTAPTYDPCLSCFILKLLQNQPGQKRARDHEEVSPEVMASHDLYSPTSYDS